MRPLNSTPDERRGGQAVGFDPELDEALRKVLRVLLKEHSLSSNQILVLSSELQRLGTHRIVEEHLSRYSRRQERL